MDVNGVQGYRTLISIHALLAESDFDRDQQDGDRSDFYPRSPCGERRHSTSAAATSQIISIHALLAESDHTGVSTTFRA